MPLSCRCPALPSALSVVIPYGIALALCPAVLLVNDCLTLVTLPGAALEITNAATLESSEGQISSSQKL